MRQFKEMDDVFDLSMYGWWICDLCMHFWFICNFFEPNFVILFFLDGSAIGLA